MTRNAVENTKAISTTMVISGHPVSRCSVVIVKVQQRLLHSAALCALRPAMLMSSVSDSGKNGFVSVELDLHFVVHFSCD